MAPEASSERMRRILILVPWVMARGEPTVDEVCARFGMSLEELTADIELLMVCGLPPFMPGDYIEAFIEDGRVLINTPASLDRPPRLSSEEALALLVAGRAVLVVLDDEAGAPLRSALEKLARAIAPGDQPFLEDLADRIAVRLDAPGSDLVPMLGRAIERRRRLRIAYFSAGRGEMTEREVDPLLVVQDQAHWYLIARDRASEEERTFRVDRIRDLIDTDEPFEPPPGFDPSRYADGLPFRASPDDVEVKVDIEPPAAWIAETVPHEQARAMGPGVTRLTLRTAQTAWLVHLMLAAAPHARIASPPELADEVRRAAREALSAYEDA